MKILIVSEIWTHPIDMGNKRLIVDQTLYLQRLGHEVHFLFIDLSLRHNPTKFCSMREFWDDRLHILSTSLFTKLVYNFKLYYSLKCRNGYINADSLYFNGIHKEINRLDYIYKFDCCIVNYFYMSKALCNITISKKVLLTHDIFADRNKNSNCAVMSTSFAEESKAAARAPYILTVQDNDAEYFKRISPNSKVLSTFSTFNFYPSEVVGNKNILYLSGSANFNLLGIEWFFDNVWDRLIDKDPEIKLLIGGGICKSLLKESLPKNVELLGYINDVDKFYSQGDIFINPTYLGTGLKIKTLESVARDKVSITRTHNHIGLYESENMPIFFSDSPDEWIEYISSMLACQSRIKSVKNRNQSYISELNEYINQQYDSLLIE